jgi:hypothetical protein
MPWTTKSGPQRHTRKANTPKKRRAWSKVANKVRLNRKYGRTMKEREGRAVRIANAVVNRLSGGSGHDRSRRKKSSRKGRRRGFRHSAATRRKISAGLRLHHRGRSRTRLRRKYGRWVPSHSVKKLTRRTHRKPRR